MRVFLNNKEMYAGSQKYRGKYHPKGGEKKQKTATSAMLTFIRKSSYDSLGY
jgi:hypothetical protein